MAPPRKHRIPDPTEPVKVMQEGKRMAKKSPKVKGLCKDHTYQLRMLCGDGGHAVLWVLQGVVTRPAATRADCSGPAPVSFGLRCRMMAACRMIEARLRLMQRRQEHVLIVSV